MSTSRSTPIALADMHAPAGSGQNGVQANVDAHPGAYARDLPPSYKFSPSPPYTQFDMPRTDDAAARVTPRLAFVIGWTVLATYNFGFGTSELNPLQNVLTCPKTSASSTVLPDCLPMSNAQFGYVTAAFTVGGFIGSLGLAPLKAHASVLRQSKYALLLASLYYILGGLVQASSSSWPMLALGRLLMGLGSGTALVTVPSYLNDISPPHLRGSVGVLNQLSIVIGILSAQALGVSSLGDRPQPGQQAPWRAVPLISAGIAVIQVVLSPFALHAPSDIESSSERKRLQAQLWGTTTDSPEEERLLSELSDAPSSADERAISIGDLLRVALKGRSGAQVDRTMQRGVLLIIFTQVAQQVSGVNSVLYFSTGILAELFNNGDQHSGGAGDAMAKKISVGITFVNFLMTFPPIPLVQEERLGRKRLLQVSALTMASAALVLGLSLLQGAALPAALSILVFAAGFSLGLGPIPFLILPELVPKKAIPAASSLGIACNWLANIALASAFLPIKDALARIDQHNGGSVFFIFVAIDALIFVGVTRYYVYREIPRE